MQIFFFKGKASLNNFRNSFNILHGSDDCHMETVGSGCAPAQMSLPLKSTQLGWVFNSLNTGKPLIKLTSPRFESSFVFLFSLMFFPHIEVMVALFSRSSGSATLILLLWNSISWSMNHNRKQHLPPRVAGMIKWGIRCEAWSLEMVGDQ